VAQGVNQMISVGYYIDPAGTPRAVLWEILPSGVITPMDLHQYLPATFTESAAYGIWRSPPPFGFMRAVGWGYNAATGRREAIMWTWP